MIYLADVNVWLALAFAQHFHHAAAESWFDQLTDGDCCFCRITQSGFLRLATNPKAFGKEAVTLIDAWRMYDAFLGDPRVSYFDEPAGLEPIWRDFTSQASFSPKIWNDAYLAAFAAAASLQVMTFDQSFTQYRHAKSLILRA
jgi:uncharacterized protein